jgi:class 3 adenylate cyclase
LFCDIRQFTDTSECLQEEIFLFTNKIAQVVHSICHSFGGFANQNKGDAFLVIWKLEDSGPNKLSALNKEADSALFSVVQICMALNYDDYFLEDISEEGNMKMKNKFSGRKGNMVQVRSDL